MATGTVLAPAHERAASRRSSSIAIAEMSGPVMSDGKAEEEDFPDGGKETREKVHTSEMVGDLSPTPRPKTGKKSLEFF